MEGYGPLLMIQLWPSREFTLDIGSRSHLFSAGHSVHWVFFLVDKDEMHKHPMIKLCRKTRVKPMERFPNRGTIMNNDKYLCAAAVLSVNLQDPSVGYACIWEMHCNCHKRFYLSHKNIYCSLFDHNWTLFHDCQSSFYTNNIIFSMGPFYLVDFCHSIFANMSKKDKGFHWGCMSSIMSCIIRTWCTVIDLMQTGQSLFMSQTADQYYIFY